MNTKALWSLSLITLFVAALLFSPAVNGNGVYAHAELGRSTYDDDIDVDTDIINLDGSATSFRVAIGYDMNRYLSVEGGKIEFGKIDFGQIDPGRCRPGTRQHSDLPADQKRQEPFPRGVSWKYSHQTAITLRLQSPDQVRAGVPLH